ncbi:hypothetical protein TCDM_12763 [Trypanosoma cruzi Dm28c]|uniref:Uncharacterized protein n=1 Tax=Trypanosoma cruzi Dm28c TaxID=1416333 RepID=V5A4Q8_TRYCR|nr:hypothetical protein TCDM_12763 [Trypanosoma cruzi Dm28c]
MFLCVAFLFLFLFSLLFVCSRNRGRHFFFLFSFFSFFFFFLFFQSVRFGRVKMNFFNYFYLIFYELPLFGLQCGYEFEQSCYFCHALLLYSFFLCVSLNALLLFLLPCLVCLQAHTQPHTYKMHIAVDFDASFLLRAGGWRLLLWA